VLLLIQITIQIVHGRLFFLLQILPTVGGEAFLQFLDVRPGLPGVVFRPFHGGEHLIKHSTARMGSRLPKTRLFIVVVVVVVVVVFMVKVAASFRGAVERNSDKR
jgi:hypothetical protein